MIQGARIQKHGNTTASCGDMVDASYSARLIHALCCTEEKELASCPLPQPVLQYWMAGVSNGGAEVLAE